MSYGTGLRAALLASSAIVVAYASPALAESKDFDVPAQPASSGIAAFAEQADVQILVMEPDTRGRQTQAVHGNMTTTAALQLLLAGTGLKIIADDGRTVTLSAKDPQSGSAAGDGADQGTVQALVVTAQKREENIQDVPIAMSAFSQEDLTRSQVAGGPDLMTQVPNFTFTKTNFSGYSIQIRGIGTQAISATTDPAVAVAFNNTPFIRNRFFEQEFYDLERVEVLRGPQGTLYGRNATAGVVNILSAKPKNHFEAKLSGDVSNYNSTRLEGMINIPLVEDKAALRVAGAWTKRDGFVKNTLSGQQTDGRDLWSTRVSLGLNPTDKLSVNLIWEHFKENDDRLRSGKQLCHAVRGPTEIEGVPIQEAAASLVNLVSGYLSQSCGPASLYSPDSFDTPYGFALAYYGALGAIGLPVYIQRNPYLNTFQSRNLREIETHIKPDYEASSDVTELQWKLELPWNLTLASETGFSKDHIFSFEDYNRFDTTPDVFDPGGRDDNRYDVTDQNGVFCDPQLGCTNRLAAGDLSTALSKQFSQEFRLSSDFQGRFNFSVGANFLRYDTEDKYYVFINTLSMWEAYQSPQWVPGVTDNSECLSPAGFYGYPTPDTNASYRIFCAYVDPNDVHHLNDEGRNYFLSRNPYHLLSYAAFGEAYYNITDNLKLTAGFRWTDDKKTAPQIPSWLLAGGPSGYYPSAPYGYPVHKVINQEWREPTGRVALDWKPDLSFTDQTLVYGSYVRGYKAGGANPPPHIPVFATVCPPDCSGFGIDTNGALSRYYLTHPETFEPEFVNAYEIGTKNTLLDGRLTANLSTFYYDYTGYQISEIVDRAAINLNFDAKVQGAELELDWRPLENLRIGFKGGYEDTRVADGMKAIDLMDRTAGKEGWVVVRPFPTLPSNCVAPTWVVLTAYSMGICPAYAIGVDPVTYLPYVPNPTVSAINYLPAGYPGYDPTSANNGQGFEKDLSGHQLPNAPKFTATITADYTVPLPNDWLMTLHADLYRQSEAWTRIFNDPGYDKLKAYNNVNVAAIFSNEDAGWQVMAYVKNVFDKDNITGAFLNSDDTGLTTNVFLNEPRLYGLRVTKNWTGGSGWIAPHTPGAPYMLTVEAGAQGQRIDTPGQAIMPYADVFSGDLDPARQQRDDLDWTAGGQMRVTYRPEGSPWTLSGGVRYGRVGKSTGRLRQEEVTGDAVCRFKTSDAFTPYLPGVDLGFIGKLFCDPQYGPITKDIPPFGPKYLTNRYNSNYVIAPTNRLSTSTDRREDHMIVDFDVGKDMGLGAFGPGESSLRAGLRSADFKSRITGDMRAVPDVVLPDDGWVKYNTTFHQYIASFDARREFKGAGPTLSWEASRAMLGDKEAGQLDVDWSITGGALYGKQKTAISGAQGSDYFNAKYPTKDYVLQGLPAPAQTPFAMQRTKSVLAPVLDLSLGLSFNVPGVKLSTGYRWERYFNVLDAGFAEHKSYDRTIDGPYFKVSIGFGG
jgi:iron complex outermembrane receptor protein